MGLKVIRLGVVVLGCAVLSAGCRDNGLADRNLPLDEARTREFQYPVYEPTPDHAPVALAGRHWIRATREETIPQRLLVQVGDAAGTPLYALRSERAPFSRLYAPVSQNRWAPYLRLN
ncbi:MAG TPA: hypothetical protein VFZ69_08370 [Longimicrobiales bacterium]